METLSGQLIRLKAGPFEAIWERTLSEVEAEFEQAPTAGKRASAPDGVVAELASLVESSPATAVLEGYARIEEALRRLVTEPPVDVHLDLDRLGAPALAQLARRDGRISDETVQAVEGLSVLRKTLPPMGGLAS